MELPVSTNETVTYSSAEKELLEHIALCSKDLKKWPTLEEFEEWLNRRIHALSLSNEDPE